MHARSFIDLSVIRCNRQLLIVLRMALAAASLTAGRKLTENLPLRSFDLRGRNVYQYSGKKNWTKGFYNWLATIKFAHSAQQVTLQEYIDLTNECSERIKRITEQIQVHVEEWSRAPFVKAYQALRGVSHIVATTVVSEIGDMRRFPTPKQLMAYLGLIP